MNSYAGLNVAASENTPHLGGNIKAGDPFTYCPTVWNYLIDRFAINSVLDIGSGRGFSALYFHNRGTKVLAVDGFDENVMLSVYPTVKLDLTVGPIVTRVDLVHCQEVVEHIEEKHLGNLLDFLVTGKITVMTHALPGQAGHHHVNLQPPEYWIDHMMKRGCVLLETDTRRIRELAKRDGADFMANTGMVFANTARI